MRNLLKAVLIASIIVVGIRLFTVENKGNLEDFEISKTETELIFTNIKTKSVIKTINLEADNPYIQKYGKKKNTKHTVLNTDTKDLRDFPISKSNLRNFEYSEKIGGSGSIAIRTGAGVTFSRNKQFVAVNYGVGIAPANDPYAIYRTTYFKIYNSKGVLLNEVELLDRGCDSYEISENGDFIGGRIFLEYRDKGGIPMGYMVVEISSGRIVTEDFPPKDTDHTVGGSAKHHKNNQMYFSFRRKGYFILYTYDFDNAISYVLRYRAQDMGLRERLKDGYKMYISSSDSVEFVPFTEFETKEWDIAK